VADSYFKIFKVTAKEAADIDSSPNEPHVHEFEELPIVSMAEVQLVKQA
jgi:hypothetical protein